jgi:hypothetical protein
VLLSITRWASTILVEMENPTYVHAQPAGCNLLALFKWCAREVVGAAA